jgi:hypothetical protein
MLGLQPRDQPQDSTLAAAARSQNTNEFSLVVQVFDDKRDVANRGKCVGSTGVKRLGHALEFDDARALDFG